MPNEAPTGCARGNARLIFKRDPELPISARREEIAAVLARHQVLIVAGDTGSGKSTQLPQICLESGRGIDGLIAHTQPRRLAARALATRIADELSQTVGAAVGFRVRFADRVSEATRLVLMTDGLLLAELSGDPLLRRYDTIIVDEAHERTLNIDLLLGVLQRLLPRRPDLKLIVTSATLEVERVSRFFGDAPIIAVSGRNHPIEVRYASTDSDADPDLPLAVLAAFQDIETTPGAMGDGDVLVFLPGEREIRDVGEFLARDFGDSVEVLELYSRLSWEQQSKIFQRGSKRRVVLATNVAETSITVPGIRAVIDSGLARISRYSPRNRLQRLPIEPVSRASAEQRKGRCGRLGPGICVRLYTEADFGARAAFTEPEVLRTNLAALLLRLAADGLGEAENFPFIDPPDSRALGDGYRLLQELEALDGQRQITRLGRTMARLPLDPRLARALIESKRFRAESELLAIASGLSVPDARLAQSDGAGDDPVATAVLEDAKSEFSALVKLWRAYRITRQRPRRELRAWCKERGLSLLRLSEWEDVYLQVVDRAAQIGISASSTPASYAGVHRSLLAGFCTMVGTRTDDGSYLSTRGVHMHIFPGSPLKRRRPRWVMAASIVETSRVFARRVAEVEPKWIEAAAHHLLKREYLEPDWDDGREEVVARERISFLGLTLSANRIVNYGPIEPEASRLIFAREALVYRRMLRRPAWLRRNDDAILAAQRLEERLRTRDLLRLPEFFVEFYDRGLPRQVSSAASLDHFTRRLVPAQLAALEFQQDDIFARQPDPALLARFPERVALPASATAGSGLARPVSVSVDYRFAPGQARDGATLLIPLLAVPELTRAIADGAVPGLAEPRVDALLRSLPKDARRSLIPIAATVASFMEHMGAPSTNIRRLTEWLVDARGIPAPLVRFDASVVPPHLTVQIAVIESETPASGALSQNKTLAEGGDIGELRRRCAARARAELDRRSALEWPGTWRRFDREALPEDVALDLGIGAVQVYPTLVQGTHGIAVRFEWSLAEAARNMRCGGAHLARLMLERQARDLSKTITADAPLLLAASPYLNSDELAEALLQMTFMRACFEDADPPRVRTAFIAAVERGRETLYPTLVNVVATARAWFAEAREVRRALDHPRVGSGAAVRESHAHLRRLLSARTLSSWSADWLRQLPRYLKAEARRWQRLQARGTEPPDVLRELEDWNARFETLDAQVAAELRRLPLLDELRGWIEEYRVSLYAQELRTQGPVSAARLTARAAEIEAWITR